MSDVRAALEAALEGGPERHRKKVAEQQKMPVRERVARLLPQEVPHAALALGVAVEGRGVEIAQARVPRRLQHA